MFAPENPVAVLRRADRAIPPHGRLPRWIFLFWPGTGTSAESASTRRTSRPFRRAFHANRKRLGIGFPAVFRRQGELADLEEDMKTFALNRHRGILSALGSALLFGASTPLAKLAVSSADPLLIAGLLYLGSGIGLAISRTIRAGPLTKLTETPLSRADLPWLAGATLAGGVIGPELLLLGLLTTQAPRLCFSIWRPSRLRPLHGSFSVKTWTSALARVSRLSSWEVFSFHSRRKAVLPSPVARCHRRSLPLLGN